MLVEQETPSLRQETERKIGARSRAEIKRGSDNLRLIHIIDREVSAVSFFPQKCHADFT